MSNIWNNDDDDIMIALARYEGERKAEAAQAPRKAGRPAGLGRKDSIRAACLAFAQSRVGQEYRNGHLWLYVDEYLDRETAPDTCRRELGFLIDEGQIGHTLVDKHRGLHRIDWVAGQ